MSNLTDVFNAHKKKRASYAPPSKKEEPNKKRTTRGKSTFKPKWKSNNEPNLNSKRSISDTPLDGLNILFLDTAADSLNPEQASLFQVSMLAGNFNSGHWKDDAYRVSSVPMPSHFILSLEAEDDLFPDKRVLPFEEVMSNVIDAFNTADLVVCYSSTYHIQLLACEARRAGMELPPIHVLDPFVVYSTAYKYSRGKKLVNALEKYGSKINDFGTPGFHSRTPLSLKWLVEQMIQDENCSSFLSVDSLSELTKEQLISSAMNFISLKEFFSKQANGRTVTWRPWPPAPDGTHVIPESISEVVPELDTEFSNEPAERPQTSPVSFEYFSSNSLFQSLAVGLFTSEDSAKPVEVEDCSILSFIEDGNLMCNLTGKNSDSMNLILSDLNKFPLTAIGVEEQVFEPVNTLKNEDGTLTIKLVLCQK